MDTNNTYIKRLIGVITFILVFLLFSRPPLDADLWWHLRAGQTMWAQKNILLTDPFSYTRLGAPWVNAFWLSEICLYLFYRLGGYFALATFVSLSGAITFHFIYHRLPGNNLINSFIIILAALTAAPIWGPRPQIISFFIIAWLDMWLSGINREMRPKWILVPVFALWANIHGGWIWGFLLLFSQAAGMLIQLLFEQSKATRDLIWGEARSLIGWSALAGLAIGINPNGIAIWKLPFQQINVSLQLQEWLSPDFHRIDFHPLLWMLFLLIALAPFAGKPPSWSRVFNVLGFAYLTFVAQRNIALFAIVATPLLSNWANEVWNTLRNEKSLISLPKLNPHITRLLNPVIVVSLSLASLGYLFTVSQPAELDKRYPSRAIQWIKDNQPEGRLFNSYNWGGYILWNLPEYPVFIDGRADLYGHEIISDWQMIMSGSAEGINLLDSWNIGLVFIETDQPVVNYLEKHGWNILYRDEMAIILGR